MVDEMRSFGFLFPGQGAQTVGMGFDLFESNHEARNVFEQADSMLGFPLSQLCFKGPESELTRTANAQVAIFVTSLAALRALHSIYQQLKPLVACGLSLGEFTALVALGAISFEDGLKLVRKRGELMETAHQQNPGTMASIIGLPLAICETISKESGAVIANINADDQIVMSGTTKSIEQACRLAEAKGVKRAIPLKVGGAFHSPLMKPAEEGLRDGLRAVPIKPPKGKFIPNVTGEPISDPELIRRLLAEQLTQPVQWVKTMEWINREGPAELLEIGPGRVLKGLARRITNSRLTVHHIEKTSDIESMKSIFLSSAHAA